MGANPNKVGLWFGAMLGGLHLLWAFLVVVGLAQKMYDFILWAHMIHINIQIGPFEFNAALTLVIVTAIIGYVLGYVGAWAWNKTHKV